MSAPKRDFGSFHSSNVQELLSLSEAEWDRARMPVPKAVVEEEKRHQKKIDGFGGHLKQELFVLTDEFTFLNHGAFGGAFRSTLAVQHAWQLYIESQPVRFVDRELFNLLTDVIRMCARAVSVPDPRDIVLFNNATTAINTVVRSVITRARAEKRIETETPIVLCTNVTYGSTKKLLQTVVEEETVRANTGGGVEVVETAINFPLETAQVIVDRTRETLEELKRKNRCGDITLVIIDAIPSNAPVCVPVGEVVRVCREYAPHAKILVDGAHMLGGVEVDVPSMGADYVVFNCHKWLCSAKGCAFMYVSGGEKKHTHPLVISHGYGAGFTSNFIWHGLQDFSAWLSLSHTLRVWESIGAARMREYMHTLCRDAARLLASAWGTRTAAPESMFRCMSLVLLPDMRAFRNYVADPNAGGGCDGTAKCVLKKRKTDTNGRVHLDYAAAERVQHALYNDFSIEVPIKALDGALYVRISAHVYNHLDGYQRLADAVNALKERDAL